MKQYQSESINELAAALAKAQSQMTHASKDANNPHFKTRYADLSAVIDAARPHLAANGLSVVQITDTEEGGSVSLMTQLNHASGQWMRSWYPVKPVKNDPQGFGSALTYARRYSYAAIAGVAAAGEDDDGNNASGHDQDQKQKPPEYKGEFESRELLDVFVADTVDALGKTESATGVKDQKILNAARWTAMKNSSSPLDRDGYEKIVAAYNTAFSKHKPVAGSPATVDAAKQQASLPVSVAGDEIPF